MDNNKAFYKDTIEDIFYLAKCAINNSKPSVERIAAMNGESIFAVASYHSVEALIFYSFRLCDLGITIKDKAEGKDNDIMSKAFGFPKELMEKWSLAYKAVTMKNIQLDVGRAELFDAMEQMGCWYLPLKGAVIKEMYPAAGMRQMSDNDILFDESFRFQVRKWFEDHGYKTEYYDTGCEDVYIKLPYRFYELHVSLIGEDKKSWYSYYKNIKEKLVKDDGKEYAYSFTDEDYYVYMILHAYKHYASAGTGIRIFFDMYIYLDKKKDSMDWEYIKQQCELLDILAFEELIKKLTEKMMSGEESFSELLTESERKTLLFIIESGTYGTVSNRIKKGISNNEEEKPTLRGKVRYLISRIFIPKELMYLQNPFCRKHHWTLPAYYFIRIIKGLTQKRIYDEVGRTVKMK